MGDEKDLIKKEQGPQTINNSLDGQMLAQNQNPAPQQPTVNKKTPPSTNTVPVERFPDQGNKQGNKVAAIEAFFADPKNTELSTKKNDPAAVRELQQALIDLQQLDPKTVKLGTYDTATEKAVNNYRKSRGGSAPITKKGDTFDKQDKTLVEDHFRGREVYVEAATAYDKKKPQKGTRPLDSTDKTAIKEVYEQPKSTAKTTPTPTNKPSKETEENIRKDLSRYYKKGIESFYTTNYKNKKKQREAGEKAEKKDPQKENEFLFTKSSIEDIANTAKKVVDSLYGGMATTTPTMKMDINLFDYWEEQNKRHPSVIDKKGTLLPKASNDAKGFFYQIKPQIDQQLNIKEKKELLALGYSLDVTQIDALQQNVLEDLLKDKDIVEQLIRAEQGTSGLMQDKKQYLQRFKSDTTDPTQKMEEDRLKRWKIFYTSIHEYTHQLSHVKYEKWLKTTKGNKRRILAEGVCEFFALNVYAKFPPSALKGAYQEKIEGRKPATGKIPTFKETGKKIYPEHKQAEQLARTVGIHNLQAAYFQGKTGLLDET